MNPITCALTLILACGSSRAAVALNLTHAGMAFADTTTTQNVLSLCKRVGRSCWEGDPLQQPFQSYGRPWAYTSTYLEVAGTTYLAARLAKSESHGWRIAGRIFQIVQISAHAYGIRTNIALGRDTKRKFQ